MSAIKCEAAVAAAKEFISFVNKSFTPFHAVKEASEMLEKAGYQRLEENVIWPPLRNGGKYYLTRNGSSIVAFAVGGLFTPANGIKIVGAHTDSPNLALKPRTKSNSDKYKRVAVQCYGGGLWHTWFDRDLTVAGRVVLDTLESKLVHINKPLMRIPTLAIHLCSQSEREAFSPNKERHLIPVIATELTEKINNCIEGNDKVSTYCLPLFHAIAEAVECDPSQICDFDLSVLDTQEAVIGGVNEEFIFAPRIDNLLSCFCALRALCDTDNLEDDTMIRMICLFDHEEIGSSTSPGAGGTLIPDIIERIVNNRDLRSVLCANSFLLSVDGSHAVHPNYRDKHEEEHRPYLHSGPVIKYNANARYATNGVTAAIIKDLAKKANVPIQEFVVKNDSPCGSTIGPILSSLSGIKAVDIGNPMLSMHSIREMCGTVDVYYLTALIQSFFMNYGK